MNRCVAGKDVVGKLRALLYRDDGGFLKFYLFIYLFIFCPAAQSL